MKLRNVAALWLVIGLGLTLGCGPDEAAVEQQAQTERQGALDELMQAKQALDDLRSELASVRQRIEDPSTVEVADGEEPPSAEELGTRAEELANQVQDGADQLAAQVVNFINEDPPVAGEPLTDPQRQAVDLKIDEDILVAREWIDTGGDYRRAINILEALVPLDPENARLQEQLAMAQEMRFMTTERFELAKKGMTEAEVREALGPVNLRNVKTYEDRGVTAWFYPKEDGSAAGVFFNKKGGALKVYRLDYEAVPKPEEA